MKRLLCKLGLHKWRVVGRERLYGDVRLIADYDEISICDRCDRASRRLRRDRRYGD